MVITTGAGPQEKVMTPPLATAATTASEVQLAAVPLPTTVVGCVVSTGCASAGMGAWPSGLPKDAGAGGIAAAAVLGVGVGDVGEVCGVVALLPFAGLSEPDVAVLAAGLPCAEVAAVEVVVEEEAEPQAAVVIARAAAMAATA
jgi:hypothetical protein